MPQGSILGPILFNIFPSRQKPVQSQQRFCPLGYYIINDLLFLNLEADICNFADDNTLSACDSSIDRVVTKLTSDIPCCLELV